MNSTPLDGITEKTIKTARLSTRALFGGTEDGAPVLFLHGHLASASWWEETMLALPPGFRGIAPDQRGFGEADPAQKIDARRGMGDLADDARALLDTLKIDRAYLVGHAMGGAVIWQMLVDIPERILGAVLVAPVSPYGFGGTKDVEGTPCMPGFAGSGAGLFNRPLMFQIGEGNRDEEVKHPFSPRSTLRRLIVKPPFIPAREETLVDSMLAIHVGEKDLPGDVIPSRSWPFMEPGVWGAMNALSPKYMQAAAPLLETNPKPPVLWIRGADDVFISDQSLLDTGTMGARQMIQRWPGPGVFPPQPMIGQTQAVLDRYAGSGGSYRAVVVEGCGHAPFIEKPAAFNAALHEHLHQNT